MMPTLIRKPQRTSQRRTPDVGRGARIQEVRRRLVHPPKPGTELSSEVLPVPASAPPDPSLFRMGTDLATGRELLLRPEERFERQPHLLFVGAPGTGKTTKMLNMINSLLCMPDISIFILNPKGDFGRKAIDLVLGRKQGYRLEVLDPGDERYVASYNPVRLGGLSWSVAAKQLREGIRQSANLTSFDVAAQMARVLFMFLAMTKLFDLTLADTAQLVRPKSVLRRQLIPKVPDPDLRFALQYFDSLPEKRQDELGSSSLAKLESWAFDPVLKRVTSRKGPSLDVGEIMDDHKILIADIREDDPLRTDDARQLGRFLVNDITAHAFGRKAPASPCYLVLDEAYAHCTDDLARGLSRGREPGLKVWLACQYVDQFILEDGNTRIRDSVMKCIENRIVFRTPDVDDAKQLAKQLFFAHTYTPWAEKYSRKSIETEPVETTRVVQSSTHTVSTGEAVAYPRSRSLGVSASDSTGTSHGISRGEHESFNTADTRGSSVTESDGVSQTVAQSEAHTVMEGVALTRMQGKSRTDGQGETQGVTSTHGEGAMATDAASLALTYDGPLGAGLPSTYVYTGSAMTGSSSSDSNAENRGMSRFRSEGTMEVEGETLQHAEAATRGVARADTVSQARAHTLSDSHTDGYTYGTSLTVSDEASRTHTDTRSDTVSEGVTPSFSREESRGESHSVVPFTAFIKRSVKVDLQYLTEDEQLNLHAIGILRMPDQHYFLQLATLPTRAMREPDSIPPMLSDEERAAELLTIHSRPTYTPLAQIETEEQERNTRTAKGTKASGSQKIAAPLIIDDQASPGPLQPAAGRPSFWS